jgi:capsular polysaccharide biosynthesis protein
VNDPDRTVTWPAGMDGELPEHLWTPDGFLVDDEPLAPGSAGGLVSLAFFWEAVRRKAWLWCITAALGLLIGTGLYLRYPPAYHAQTTILLVDSANQDPAVEVTTDQTLAESEPVAAGAVQELGSQQSVASLQAAYSVTPLTDTVLQLNVGAPTSAEAIQRASALATSFLKYRAKYAQTQEQQSVAQLDLQYSAAQQRLESLDTEIGQLPVTNLTPAQKIQYDNLETQLGDQKQIMQYATATQAANKTATDAMVSGSYVLNPAALVSHSRVKSAALYVAGGLFVGLVVGMAIVIIGALLSSRLRRRDDVAIALGAPVRLSVGSLRAPRLLPVRARRKVKRDRDARRVVAYLRAAVPGSSRGPASMAVVATDDVQTVASIVASLARSRASGGRQVVLADLSSGGALARRLGVSGTGVHEVTQQDVRLLVVVPERDDAAPVGPVRGGGSPAALIQPDEALVAACSSADLLLSFVTLDPALGGDYLATWASDAVVVVTAGRSTVTKVQGVGEMIRLAGIRLDSAVLIDADRSDESLGTLDLIPASVGGAAKPGEPERGADGIPIA